jgi:hypothetical protein
VTPIWSSSLTNDGHPRFSSHVRNAYKKRVPFRMLDDSPALAQGTKRSMGFVTRPAMQARPSIHAGTASF